LKPELRNAPAMRSPNLYSDPVTVLEVYGYDVEAHAEEVFRGFLEGRMSAERGKGVGKGKGERHVGELVDEKTGVEKWRADRTMNWFLGDEEWWPIRQGTGEVLTGWNEKDEEDVKAKL
jgi:hypothetical protein